MDSSPPSSISRILAFALALHVMMLTGSLTKIRTEMTNKNQSAFEVNGNGVYLIIAIVAFFMAEVMSGILFLKNIPSGYYKVLKFVDIFMVFLAPFSLLNVLHPPNLVPCVIMAITLAYASCGDDKYDKSLSKTSPIAIFTYCGLFIVPIMLMMVLFVSASLDSIVFPFLHLSFGVEFICFFVIWFNFMMKT